MMAIARGGGNNTQAWGKSCLALGTGTRAGTDGINYIPLTNYYGMGGPTSVAAGHNYSKFSLTANYRTMTLPSGDYSSAFGKGNMARYIMWI